MRLKLHLLPLFCLFWLNTIFATNQTCDLSFSNKAVLRSIEIADTAELHAQGLSGRALAGRGMLFVWPDSENRVFWMRNTHVPLEIGFFDTKGRLFSLQRMAPNSDAHHLSGKPARFALEMSPGRFQRHGLGVGVRLMRFCGRGV